MLAGHRAPDDAPGDREREEAEQQGPQLAGGIEQDAAGPAGLAGGAARGGAACRPGAWAGRRGGAGEGGGHEPISAICVAPSVTRALGSGWKPHWSRYAEAGMFPLVMIQVRKSLTALALAGLGWRVLTTAYS